MHTFTMPAQLNGEQLISELKIAGVIVEGFPEDWADGLLRLKINENDVEKTEVIVNNHVPLDSEITKATQKAAVLARLGITDDEAKLLLS
jgi:hypothetical protein